MYDILDIANDLMIHTLRNKVTDRFSACVITSSIILILSPKFNLLHF